MLVATPGLVVADVAGPDAVLPVVGSQAPGAVVTEVAPLLPVAGPTIVPVAVVTRVGSRPSEQGDGRHDNYQIITEILSLLLQFPQSYRNISLFSAKICGI